LEQKIVMNKKRIFKVALILITIVMIIMSSVLSSVLATTIGTSTAITNLSTTTEDTSETTSSTLVTTTSNDTTNYDYTINLSDLSNFTTYETLEELEVAKDSEGNLPEGIYVTTFLYDGVGKAKTLDLEDFVAYLAGVGDEVDVEDSYIEATVININTTGNIEITGEIEDAMIAVNTNGKSGAVNLYLNNVSIDTGSKKFPAIYVYNQDINYEECKVTIKTVAGSENYIEGGKFKKNSLMDADSLSDYASKYASITYTYEDDNDDEVKTSVSYEDLAQYYGIYTKEQMGENYENILFARVNADSEDLRDGDPTVFYKGSGAISSDIDLYFEGEGYLEVVSKNKEGIETKGNLILSGGTGDYYVFAEDDALNATTSKDTCAYSSYKNDIEINVNTLIAIADPDGDEGDAIDANGSLTITGGTIVALACPGGDGGLDADGTILINGGTVFATGDMYDEVSDKSEQTFLAMNLSNRQSAGDNIYITDSNGTVLAAYTTDRTYSNLVYSSPELSDDGEYKLYSNGDIDGELLSEKCGYYENVTSATGGTEVSYSQATGMGGGMNGGFGERANGTHSGNSSEASVGGLIAGIAMVALALIAAIIAIIVIAKKSKKAAGEEKEENTKNKNL